MYKINGYLLLIVVMISCKGPTLSEKKQKVLGLQDMNDLATAEYVITKVIKANDNQTWFKVGDRKILLSCTGYIKAGIDLSLLKEDDIMIEKNTISVTLPAPKIISLNIPPENVHLEHEQVGFFRQKFSNTEQNDLMIQAETQIRSMADSLGILTTAQKNTKKFITDFLIRLGYKNVKLNFKNNTADKK
jgi:hypothetical protein